jgi:cyclopropane fatty-acyl-phospholipid synthase-like methyltransferase
VAVYDSLARHYDAVTGDSSTETAFIDDVIKRAHPAPVTLLEVACGTGGILASLAGRYRVAGLDISPGMLAVARVKFDAVICVYHGINHLLGFPAWESFFDCARRHLNDDGVLVFDTYTIRGLEAIAGIPEIVEKFGANSLHIRVRASDESVFDWHIEVRERRRDGGHGLLTEKIRTVAFPLERIQKALSERFATIEIFESDGGAGDESDGGAADESGSRTWFVCTRPRPVV